MKTLQQLSMKKEIIMNKAKYYKDGKSKKQQRKK